MLNQSHVECEHQKGKSKNFEGEYQKSGFQYKCPTCLDSLNEKKRKKKRGKLYMKKKFKENNYVVYNPQDNSYENKNEKKFQVKRLLFSELNQKM